MSRTLTHAVWETTRRCDQVCLHCVNASGKPAPGELTPQQAQSLCQGLIALGVREVSLTGGESYLRRDIYAIIETLKGAGITIRMQTGGFTLTSARARRLKEAGLSSLGVSIDGLKEAHDHQRGRVGSFDAALKAIDTAREAGLPVGVNTQLNRLSIPHLRPLSSLLRDKGVSGWLVFLTLPEGRAGAHLDWILQPYDIPEVQDTLAEIQLDAWAKRRPHEETIPFNVTAGANLGYFGPRELTLRSSIGEPVYWNGPQDALNACFIACDGRVTGSTFLKGAKHRMGSLKEETIEAIWGDETAGAYTRRRDTADLSGFCRSCYYADTCFGGDILSAEAFFGERGNYAHCAHRALTLAKEGNRERIIPKGPIEGGAGAFRLIQEAIPEAKSRAIPVKYVPPT